MGRLTGTARAGDGLGAGCPIGAVPVTGLSGRLATAGLMFCCAGITGRAA
jgi:hypothetical protein